MSAIHAVLGVAALGAVAVAANNINNGDINDKRIDDLVCIMFHENSKGIENERTGFVWVTLNRFRYYKDWDKAIKSLSATNEMYEAIQKRIIWGSNIYKNPKYDEFRRQCHETFAQHNAWFSSGGKVDAHEVGMRFNWIHIATQVSMNRKVPAWARKEPIVIGKATFSNPINIFA